VGDVNSTMACALVASKLVLQQPFDWSRQQGRTRPIVVHVEAGLRSFDEDMPEEINRRVTDVVSDLLFVSEPSGVANLDREGTGHERIHFVGNVMIDTLLQARDRAMQTDVLEQLGLTGGGYGLVTLHRPSNVDDPDQLRQLLGVLDEIARDVPLVFPVHPRTRKRLDASGVSLDAARWRLTDPVGYLEFLRLTASARIVLTDSGGIQEETTILGVRCLTLRENTERPVTIEQGSNFLAGTSGDSIRAAYRRALAEPVSDRRPDLWDGRSAERIVSVLETAMVR
jgi:UDP-N-acetylglucosamine 2-epimerase (non-hydrolysing)